MRRVLDFIAAIEAPCGREAVMEMKGMQPGDLPATWADTRLLKALTGSRPETPLATGIGSFVAWYRDYYSV